MVSFFTTSMTKVVTVCPFRTSPCPCDCILISDWDKSETFDDLLHHHHHLGGVPLHHVHEGGGDSLALQDVPLSPGLHPDIITWPFRRPGAHLANNYSEIHTSDETSALGCSCYTKHSGDEVLTDPLSWMNQKNKRFTQKMENWKNNSVEWK